MKIVTVVGARPQFIKAATISRELALRNVEEIIVHTGQHYDEGMSAVFFTQMEIPSPRYHLGIGGGSHGMMTGRQLEGIEKVLLSEKPDWVLVYGDTNSTLAGALAAAKLHMPIAHVEAGLRSFNRKMPEEINRVLTDHVSKLLFAPTLGAVENLAREGIGGSEVRLVGDVMHDATLFYKSRAVAPRWWERTGLTRGKFILCTIHRAENTDNHCRLREILEGLGDSGQEIILPMHPRTERAVLDGRIRVRPNVRVVPPVGYLEMCWLEMNCWAVITDSGGVQKEAFFHGKPCLTLREETEWLELVAAGWNRLVPAKREDVAEEIRSLRIPLGARDEIYGNGTTAAMVATMLVSE